MGDRLPRRTGQALAAAVLLAAALSACGGGPRASEPLARWLSVDAPAKAVTLQLHAAYNDAYNGFNFNGYGKGQVLVEVPRGWRVTVRCVNDASETTHSCGIVNGPTGLVAFPGAATRPLEPQRSASFGFRPRHVGMYRIACVVLGHEDAGMWDVLEVTAQGRPRVQLLRRMKE